MVATALVAVTRLGGAAVFWGAVGDDWMGERILRQLIDERVDVSGVKRVPGARGPMDLVLVDRPTGERYFRHWIGVEAPAEPIGSLERLQAAGCLLVDGWLHANALRAAREARRSGIPVVADLGRIDEAARALLGHVDYAIVSEGCARRLELDQDLRRACEALHAMGPEHVVITRGGKGLVYLTDGEFRRMPAFAVKVVDTTGAGDTFHGAFCYGLVEGWPLERNLVFASATAAMQCRRLGGRAGIPTRGEVTQFLAERGVDWAVEDTSQRE
jgi:sugar/nucleoside kinase (ribokinase family)